MRRLLLAFATVLGRFSAIMSLVVAGLSADALVRLFMGARGTVIAPDTGFLIALVLLFGTGGFVSMWAWAVGRRQPSRDLGWRLVAMSIAFAFVAVVFALQGLDRPFYGPIPTLGDLVLLLLIEGAGLLCFAGLAFAGASLGSTGTRAPITSNRPPEGRS